MALALSPLTRGRLTVRLAAGPKDRQAALELRRLCFRRLRGLPEQDEGDGFDALADHLLVYDEGGLLATCRLRLLSGPDLAGSYSGQFYDLAALNPLPALELGRFCLAPEAAANPDPLRLTFAALARLVDATGAGLLMGCTSFDGNSMAPYRAALTPWLDRLRPDVPAIASESVALSPMEPGEGRLPLPPLLRHYLALGGLLSDQAVIDRGLQTCHVLTVLPIAAIPAPHARALRALAQDA